MACLSAFPATAQTRAGTLIPNTAQLSFEMDGAAQTTHSNTAIIHVAKLLDLRLAARSLRIATVPGALTPIPFTLTNASNGREAFKLAAGFPDGTVEGFAIDGDGDGLYDPAHDTLLAAGTTPRLNPGQTVNLLVLVRSDSGKIDTLTVVGRAVTRSGRRGDVVNITDEGGSATVGLTDAMGTLVFTLTPMAGGDPTLEKRQSVRNPAGGEDPGKGAVVTYTLIATFPRAARDAVVADPIPQGTRYIPGSLTLDGATLTDAADTDPGSFDGTGIGVTLGDLPAATTRTIKFKVTIQ